MVDVRNLLERAAPDAAPVDIEAIRHGAAQRRRRRRRLGASGLVLVLLIVGTATWVSIRDGDQPAESQVATTPETAPREQTTSSTTVPACRLTLQSTAVPAGWDEETFPGDGGEAGDPAAIAHWRAGRGRYVNILEPDNGHLPVPASGAEGGGDTQRVDVLGVTAEVRAIHEGYGVAVALPADPPCGFALVGYGITQSQLADLTEGLYTTSAAGRPSFDTLGAFWPEGAAADVPDIQTLTNEQGWRLSAEETALRYGRDLFRSRDVALAPDGGEPSEDGRNGVVLGVRSGDQTAIVKLTRAVGHRWFSVYEAIVPFRPTTPTRPEESGCPVLVDAGGRRWTTAAAETLPDGVLQDGDARLALTGRSTAELRLRDRQYRLVVPSDDSGDRCGV